MPKVMEALGALATCDKSSIRTPRFASHSAFSLDAHIKSLVRFHHLSIAQLSFTVSPSKLVIVIRASISSLVLTKPPWNLNSLQVVVIRCRTVANSVALVTY